MKKINFGLQVSSWLKIFDTQTAYPANFQMNALWYGNSAWIGRLDAYQLLATRTVVCGIVSKCVKFSLFRNALRISVSNFFVWRLRTSMLFHSQCQSNIFLSVNTKMNGENWFRSKFNGLWKKYTWKIVQTILVASLSACWWVDCWTMIKLIDENISL